VGLVACQKLLSRQFKALLLERGIVPLDRLSSRHISAVQTISGCNILSIARASSIQADYLGRLASVEKVTFANDLRPYLVLRPDPETFKPVRTLVLCADDHCASEELSAVVSGCIATLQSLVHSPALLAGGGCAEVMAAEYVRLKVEGVLNGLECSTLKHSCAAERQQIANSALAFASVLESCASSLGPSCPSSCENTPRCGIVQALKRANCSDEKHDINSPQGEARRELFGWDTLCNEPRIVACMQRSLCTGSAAVSQTKPQWESLAVLDSLDMKLNAVKVATDVASMIARLDSSLVS
jgi:chaperonin GroEL (HSP60 family)